MLVLQSHLWIPQQQMTLSNWLRIPLGDETGRACTLLALATVSTIWLCFGVLQAPLGPTALTRQHTLSLCVSITLTAYKQYLLLKSYVLAAPLVSGAVALLDWNKTLGVVLTLAILVLFALELAIHAFLTTDLQFFPANRLQQTGFLGFRGHAATLVVLSAVRGLLLPQNQADFAWNSQGQVWSSSRGLLLDKTGSLVWTILLLLYALAATEYDRRARSWSTTLHVVDFVYNLCNWGFVAGCLVQFTDSTRTQLVITSTPTSTHPLVPALTAVVSPQLWTMEQLLISPDVFMALVAVAVSLVVRRRYESKVLQSVVGSARQQREANRSAGRKRSDEATHSRLLKELQILEHLSVCYNSHMESGESSEASVVLTSWVSSHVRSCQSQPSSSDCLCFMLLQPSVSSLLHKVLARSVQDKDNSESEPRTTVEKLLHLGESLVGLLLSDPRQSRTTVVEGTALASIDDPRTASELSEALSA